LFVHFKKKIDHHIFFKDKISVEYGIFLSLG
jgi:hypothetical protein